MRERWIGGKEGEREGGREVRIPVGREGRERRKLLFLMTQEHKF